MVLTELGTMSQNLLPPASTCSIARTSICAAAPHAKNSVASPLGVCIQAYGLPARLTSELEDQVMMKHFDMGDVGGLTQATWLSTTAPAACTPHGEDERRRV